MTEARYKKAYTIRIHAFKIQMAEINLACLRTLVTLVGLLRFFCFMFGLFFLVNSVLCLATTTFSHLLTLEDYSLSVSADEFKLVSSDQL